MYNQSNIRLHVDLFINRWLSMYQIMFILTTTMASHSLYWIYSLLFLVAYNLWQPFVAYFRSDIDIIVFFCWAGWKWVGRRDYLTKKNWWAEREMGNTKKNTATLSPNLCSNLKTSYFTLCRKTHLCLGNHKIILIGNREIKRLRICHYVKTVNFNGCEFKWGYSIAQPHVIWTYACNTRIIINLGY